MDFGVFCRCSGLTWALGQRTPLGGNCLEAKGGWAPSTLTSGCTPSCPSCPLSQCLISSARSPSQPGPFCVTH